ncbi:MAG: hypothetical protein U0T69_00610 [Chitinophagales bacterium]
MKKLISFYSLFLFAKICLGDIPIEKNESSSTEFTNFNYLPWALGVLGALGIFVFMYIYKNEKNETK